MKIAGSLLIDRIGLSDHSTSILASERAREHFDSDLCSGIHGSNYIFRALARTRDLTILHSPPASSYSPHDRARQRREQESKEHVIARNK